MRFIRISFVTLVLSAIALPQFSAQAKDTPPDNRISIEKAREVAVRAYSGKIQSEELEFEGGKWVYSFDLKNPGDKVVHEIQVDAINGKLVGVHTETPADERKELRADQNEKKKK